MKLTEKEIINRMYISLVAGGFMKGTKKEANEVSTEQIINTYEDKINIKRGDRKWMKLK